MSNRRLSLGIAGPAAAVLLLALVPRGVIAVQSKYEADLQAFFKEADDSYPFFELKGIQEDWEKTKKQLSIQVKRCRSDAAFLGIVIEAMKCLRDVHMGLSSTKVQIPKSPALYYPGISFMPATKNRVVIMSARKEFASVFKTGTIVTRIDGRDARKVLEEKAEKAWSSGGCFSSPQRVRFFEYRLPLCGKKGERHTITVLTPHGKRRAALTSNFEVGGWPHTYNLPDNLARTGRSTYYTKLPGGCGYIYLRRVDESTEPGIREAFSAHPNVKGWIVDMRGNTGGGYDQSLLERIKGMPKPVAVLFDAGCISAGETLARDFVRLREARLFGSTTAGSSTTKRQWTFPSGIATVKFSVRSRFGPDGRLIEFNGIEPHEKVEALPEEVLRGLNSCILRAEEYLKKTP